MDSELAKSNPKLHTLLLEAIASNKQIAYCNSQPAVYEYICRKGSRKWMVIADYVVNTQSQGTEVLDDTI